MSRRRPWPWAFGQSLFQAVGLDFDFTFLPESSTVLRLKATDGQARTKSADQ